MKVYLDANILISVLNKEYPLFPFTARILSAAEQKEFLMATSPLCLAIAFYFSEIEVLQSRAFCSRYLYKK